MRVKFNAEGLRKLRQDHAIRDDLKKRADRIAEAASTGGRVAGYEATSLVLEDPRGAASVMATGHAARDNRRHNRLIRALGAGRG